MAGIGDQIYSLAQSEVFQGAMHNKDDFLREAESRNWSSLEDLNAWLAEKTRRHNARPQEELGGL